jgi:hypothetical protein
MWNYRPRGSAHAAEDDLGAMPSLVKAAATEWQPRHWCLKQVVMHCPGAMPSPEKAATKHWQPKEDNPHCKMQSAQGRQVNRESVYGLKEGAAKEQWKKMKMRAMQSKRESGWLNRPSSEL